MVLDIIVVGEVSNGEQGIELVEFFDFDLILLDFNMFGMNGLEMLDKLCEKFFLGCIVVFSVFNYEEDVVIVLKCGVDGYLLKDMELEDLLKVLYQVVVGEMVLSEVLMFVLVVSLCVNCVIIECDVNQLILCECDIFKLIVQGLSNKMIVCCLDIIESIVKVYVKYMLKKMKFKFRVEVVVWVYQECIF